jgi:predicted aldo/keto reductase-like oxidoreductase
MRKRIAGRTGLRLSEISLGGVAFSWLEKSACENLIGYCLDRGVNYLDVYVGTGEKIRQALRRRRDEFYISTRTDPEKVDEALKDLGLDYIDIMQITMVDADEHYKAAVDGLEILHKHKEQGKIGHVGIGTHCFDLYMRIIEDGYFDTIMLPFNYIENEVVEKVLPAAKQRDIGILVMKPLAGGNIERAVPSLKYILRHDVSSAVVGIASIEEAEEDIRVGGERLDLGEDEERYLRELGKKLGKVFCRRCGHCIFPEPCPQGIEIRMLMMAETIAMQSRRQTLSEEFLKKVEECTRCGRCEEICPYDLPIMDMLPEKVKEYRSLVKEMEQGTYQR